MGRQIQSSRGRGEVLSVPGVTDFLDANQKRFQDRQFQRLTALARQMEDGPLPIREALKFFGGVQPCGRYNAVFHLATWFNDVARTVKWDIRLQRVDHRGENAFAFVRPGRQQGRVQ
jgi:hypothetical protein